MFAFINDAFLAIEKAVLPINDLALNRGYGIFDFFKAINARPVFLDEHLDRFYRSAAILRLPVPYQKAELTTILEELMQRNATETAGIRLLLTGGNSEDYYSIGKPNLVITQQALSPSDLAQYSKGIKLAMVDHRRQLAQAKTIDYVTAIWLRTWLEDADDALYCHQGLITECPRANFFVVTADDTIITPRFDILAGITRQKVIDLSKANFKIEERNLTLPEVLKAKEAFITSTTKSILPVRAIDKHAIGKGDRTISNYLRKKLEALY